MADRELLQQTVARSLCNTALHLILLPTEQCNFRYTYCYETFSVGRMPEEVIRGVKRLIDRRAPDLDSLHLDWFGGEPLLAREIVEEISGHARDVAAGLPHLSYESSMTTNGYLLDLKAARRLSDLGCRAYQVTLDGPEHLHDLTRVRKGGGGSFERIWRNLLDLRGSDLDLRISLRVHLSPHNIGGIEEWLVSVRDALLTDERFSVFLKPIERMGGPNNDTIDVLDHDAAAEATRRIARLLYPAGSGARAPEVPVCYASMPSSFVVRANGIVGKCTVALDNPVNHIGRLTSDGSLELDNTKVRPWLRGLPSLDPEILVCPLAGLPAVAAPDPQKVRLRVLHDRTGTGA